jgi:hypothetical protein
MKLDYDFLKELLTALEDNQSHLLENMQLAKKVSIDIKNDDEFDKFAGHLKLLQDNFCIDCMHSDLGFKKVNSGFLIAPVGYRLTSHGYEFLEMLNEKTVFNKIKTFSISTAFEVGKTLLINQLTGVS